MWFLYFINERLSFLFISTNKFFLLQLILQIDAYSSIYKEYDVINQRLLDYTMSTLQWTPMFYSLSLGVGFILIGYYFAAMIF